MGSSITQIGDAISGQVLYPLYYVFLGFIAVIAAIVLLVKLIQAATSNRNNKPEHIKGAVIVLGICIIAGFAPGIINFFISLAGGSVPGVNV